MTDEIKDKWREFAHERAENYKQCYLPSWALDDWTDEDTHFLGVYILDAIADAVKAEKKAHT